MFIVCRTHNGALAAANVPYIHHTKEQAETEALRLAGLAAGTQYIVLEAISIAGSPVTPPVITPYVSPTVFN